MIIISWDVGIVHLAFCVLEDKRDGNSPRILDWGEIDLMKDDRITLTCCGKLKSGIACQHDSSYSVVIDGIHIGFCKTHLGQHEQYWKQEDIDNMFQPIEYGHQCEYYQKNGNQCNTNAKFKDDVDDKKYCSTHKRYYSQLRTKEKQPTLIKKPSAAKYPVGKLQRNLVETLDKLVEHFALLGVEEVVIENQPSYKNPKMKSISNTLYDYFMMRGYIDHPYGLDLKLVRFMSPSNKLKINNDNTIEVFKNKKAGKQKYKLTKELSIEYTLQLLADDPDMLLLLDCHKKKDDLCDSYLQGIYYLKILKKYDDVTDENKIINI
jgi:hypothetical protein